MTLSLSLSTLFLVDSGADNCFIDQTGQTSGVPTKALPQPRTILDLDGKPIATVTHHTMFLTLIFMMIA